MLNFRHYFVIIIDYSYIKNIFKMAKKAAPKKRIIKGRDYNTDKRSDGLRSAKSFGWRKAGTNRKPTKKEIKDHYEGVDNGVYMENRPERGDTRGRAKKGERFEKGGSIDSSINFHMNDYNRLLDADVFDSVKSGRVWDIKEIDGSKVYGKYNKEKGILFIAGKKDLSNPLVVWLKDNSFMSSDNVDKLSNGGEVNAYLSKNDIDGYNKEFADLLGLRLEKGITRLEAMEKTLPLLKGKLAVLSKEPKSDANDDIIRSIKSAIKEAERIIEKSKTKEYKKGGKIDRSKSTKKTRVNRTKKAIAQDKNIKALHGGKRVSAEGNVYYEYRENRQDSNRTKKLAKGGDLKNYTSADLPKDGSEIKIHMPEMGKFPAEDIVLKYNQDNFSFDAYRNGELSGTRITEKQVLDNLNNGIYEFKNGSNFKYKKGDVVYVYQYHSDPRNSSTDSIRNDKEEIEKYLGIDKKYIVGKKPSQQKWSKVEILEPWSEEKGWESYKVKQLDGYRKEDEFVANQSQMSKTNKDTIAIGYMEEGGEVESEEDAKGGKVGKNKLTYEIVEIPAYNQNDEEVGKWYRIYDNKGRLKTLFMRNRLNSDQKYSVTEVGNKDLAEKILEDIISGKHNEDRILKREADYLHSEEKVGGRGFFGLEKGEEIKDLSKLEKGDIILTYSKQFNAENTLKIVDVRQSGNRVVYDAVYWNPKTDKQIGSEEMSITDINLEWNDYYFPLNYKKGGKLGFEGLAKKVAKEYEGDKVKPEYQDEYGKRYDKEEAKEVGQKVAAKVYRGQQGMMEQGGEIKSELTLSEIESKLGKTFGFWSVPYEVKVDGVTYRKIFNGGNNYRKI